MPSHDQHAAPPVPTLPVPPRRPLPARPGDPSPGASRLPGTRRRRGPRRRAALPDPTDGLGDPTCGRRRIQAELALLGHEVAELTITEYMHRTSPRPSPIWRAFLTAHAREELVAIDFFVVPTSPSACSSRSSSFATTAASSSPSTSPTIPRPPGQPSSSSRRSRTIRLAVPAPGSSRDLRRGVRAPDQGHGDSPIRTTPSRALAESLRGTGHRIDVP